MKLNFDRMVFNRKSYAINASAIDIKHFETYMSSSVNNHYFQRWGGLVAGGLITAFSSTYLDDSQDNYAKKQLDSVSGSNTIILPNLGDNSSKHTKAAFGEITSSISDIARQQFTRPPTVIKDGGIIGIFLEMK